MKMLKTIALIAALGLVGLLGGCGKPSGADLSAVYAAETRPAPVVDRITVRGTVESTESRNVYSVLGLRVERVYVEAGDEVTQGQILAVLDTEDLEFAIEQQKAAIAIARQNSAIAVGDAQRMLDNAPVLANNAIQDAQRMLNEATGNLANNTNMRILHAEAALNAAESNLAEALRSREVALLDYEGGNDAHILSAEIALQQAESALASARADLAALENAHERLQIMYDAGFLAREEIRQSEIAIAAARGRYNDAQTNYNNASTAQGRSFVQQNRLLEQLETLISTAEIAVQNAQTMLAAERAAAAQEVEMLRNNLSSVETTARLDLENSRSAVANAETATNAEQMEIALRQLERQLENATITAPISGTVTAVYVRQGSIATGLMFVIEDVDNLRVITSFREYDISKITEGMEVTVKSDGTGNVEHTGIISRINPAAMPHSPIVEFETEITVTSANTGLRLGMTARIDIVFDTGVSQ